MIHHGRICVLRRRVQNLTVHLDAERWFCPAACLSSDHSAGLGGVVTSLEAVQRLGVQAAGRGFEGDAATDGRRPSGRGAALAAGCGAFALEGGTSTLMGKILTISSEDRRWMKDGLKWTSK